MKTQNVSLWGIKKRIVQLKKQNREHKKELSKIKSLPLPYSTFFKPIHEIWKDAALLKYFKSIHLRYYGEVLFSYAETYGAYKPKIYYRQRKEGLKRADIERWVMYKKKFQARDVKDFFDCKLVTFIANKLLLQIAVSQHHLRICDKEYRNLFFVQENILLETLVGEYRKYHLHVFLKYMLEAS